MARDLTTAVKAEIAGRLVRPFLLVELDFSGGTLRLWNGIGPLEWDSKTWTGAGDLLSIGEIKETSKNEATGLSINLSAIPSDIVSTSLSEHYQGRDANLWIGFMSDEQDAWNSSDVLNSSGTGFTIASRSVLDADGNSFNTKSIVLNSDGSTYFGGNDVITNPVGPFGYRMDTMPSTYSGDEATLEVNCESRLIDLKRPRTKRFTDQEQKTLYSGDKGLEFIAGLQDKRITWKGFSEGL